MRWLRLPVLRQACGQRRSLIARDTSAMPSDTLDLPQYGRHLAEAGLSPARTTALLHPSATKRYDAFAPLEAAQGVSVNVDQTNAPTATVRPAILPQRASRGSCDIVHGCRAGARLAGRFE